MKKRRKPKQSRASKWLELQGALQLCVDAGIMTENEQKRFIGLLDAQFADLFVERKA